MEAATAPLESSECGMAFVGHVPPVLYTTKLPKYALLFVPMALSGPTLIENASAPLTISTLEEFASNVQQDNCLTQPSKDVNQSAILVLFTILELTNADLNVPLFKFTHTILDTASAPQDIN
jgi:hypothetical protein